MRESRDSEKEHVDTALNAQIRYAQVQSYKGKTLGACIALSAEDLRQLGININTTGQIGYRVMNLAGIPQLIITETQPSTSD